MGNTIVGSDLNDPGLVMTTCYELRIGEVLVQLHGDGEVTDYRRGGPCLLSPWSPRPPAHPSPPSLLPNFSTCPEWTQHLILSL